MALEQTAESLAGFSVKSVCDLRCTHTRLLANRNVKRFIDFLFIDFFFIKWVLPNRGGGWGVQVKQPIEGKLRSV